MRGARGHGVRSAAVRWRRTVAGVGCVVVAFVVAGCATPGYDESRLQSELVHAGTTVPQAQCVTKGLTDKYAVSQLGSHSEPTAEELAFTRSLLSKCGIKLRLQLR
jgi:hypothetical protein